MSDWLTEELILRLSLITVSIWFILMLLYFMWSVVRSTRRDDDS